MDEEELEIAKDKLERTASRLEKGTAFEILEEILKTHAITIGCNRHSYPHYGITAYDDALEKKIGLADSNFQYGLYKILKAIQEDN